jgi:hypothetical protein
MNPITRIWWKVEDRIRFEAGIIHHLNQLKPDQAAEKCFLAFLIYLAAQNPVRLFQFAVLMDLYSIDSIKADFVEIREIVRFLINPV